MEFETIFERITDLQNRVDALILLTIPVKLNV
jgi:hypothetical protein